MDNPLKRVSLVTGASRGIGYQIARRLGKLSETLLLCSKRTTTLDAAVKKLKTELNANIYQHSVDHNIGKRAAEEIGSWAKNITNRLDVLALVAGFYIEGSLAEMTEEDFRSNMEVNFYINYFLVQQLLPLLKKSDNGRVIIIGSTAAYEAYPIVPSYGIAKWALRGLAINLRKELVNHNIGVTFVSPGGTLTDMWEGEDLPENRLLEAEDIAKLVESTLLLSKQAVVEEIIVRPMLGDIHE